MKTENHKRARIPIVVRSLILFAAIAALGATLALWKSGSVRRAEAAAANQPEPMEVVTSAVAAAREHRDVSISIGTVLATRSVTLRNEIAGTVRYVQLAPGRIVEAGAVLARLDVSIEEAELEALVAEIRLAESKLARFERMAERQAVSAIELDEARAERDIALARIERTRAIIERKTIRAPFRARVGISDVHPGQFLDVGTLLTTLQGVDEVVHVDFSVAHATAAGLRAGDVVEVFLGTDEAVAVPATIVALDARVDASTRNAAIRARMTDGGPNAVPGTSVRVQVPVGGERQVVAIPVSALRRGPSGDHVFILETSESGETRARVRQVRAGPVTRRDVTILAGLEVGDTVAVSGSFKLREAALVHIAGEVVASADGAR